MPLVDVELVHFEEEWLMRPVLKGCCKFESLLDGTLSLTDIRDLNRALDAEAENEYRVSKHLASKN